MIPAATGPYSARDLVRVPGLISLARLPLAAAFPFTIGHAGWSVAVLAAAGASDVLDGWYARRFHQQTPTGALLDGLMDKLFVLTVAATLLATSRLGVVELVLLGTRDIGEIVIALLLARQSGVRALWAPHSANLAGKVATALQFAAVLAVLLELPWRPLWIVTVGTAGVVAACTYWVKERSRLREG